MPLLEVRSVTKRYSRGRTSVVAVDDVSVHVDPGETLGIIGESGAGKSTLGRIAAGMIEPDAGSVHFTDTDLWRLPVAELRRKRSGIQAVFQEPFESLDPRMRVIDLVAEPLDIHHRDLGREERRVNARRALDRVGLQEELWQRWPAQLSGGEQQRVGIARAIVSEPRLVLLDEPTSSLDVSLRAGILQLLLDLQRERDLAYVLVSHDMTTVEYVADRVAVMYNGRIVEDGTANDIVNAPQHPYTRLLMDARLSADPRVRNQPTPEVVTRSGPAGGCGCVFLSRCPIALDDCATADVGLLAVDHPSHAVACIRAKETPTLSRPPDCDS